MREAPWGRGQAARWAGPTPAQWSPTVAASRCACPSSPDRSSGARGVALVPPSSGHYSSTGQLAPGRPYLRPHRSTRASDLAGVGGLRSAPGSRSLARRPCGNGPGAGLKGAGHPAQPAAARSYEGHDPFLGARNPENCAAPGDVIKLRVVPLLRNTRGRGRLHDQAAAGWSWRRSAEAGGGLPPGYPWLGGCPGATWVTWGACGGRVRRDGVRSQVRPLWGRRACLCRPDKSPRRFIDMSFQGLHQVFLAPLSRLAPDQVGP